jgi:hypothetical protein
MKYLVWDDEGRGRGEALPFFVDELQGKSAEYETAARQYGERAYHDEPFEEKRCFVVEVGGDGADLGEPHIVDVFAEVDIDFEAMDMGPEKGGTP